MILVDTSVLIDYLKDVDNKSTENFKEILNKGLPFGINSYIYQELLQGCKTDNDYRLLKKYLDGQKFYDFKGGRESYAKAARIYMKLRKKGITIKSTIDCLIAQMSMENDLYLLHNDADFTRMTEVISIKIWDI
jgi:predicted nucleic acid-binding protein